MCALPVCCPGPALDGSTGSHDSRLRLLQKLLQKQTSSSAPIIAQTPSYKRYEKRYELSDYSGFRNCSQMRLLMSKTTEYLTFAIVCNEKVNSRERLALW